MVGRCFFACLSFFLVLRYIGRGYRFYVIGVEIEVGRVGGFFWC